MSLLRLFIVISAMTLLSPNVLAGVFKCTDEFGNTTYQKSPCAEADNAAALDIKTGGSTDVTIDKKELAEGELLKRQQQAEIQKQKDLEAKRVKSAQEQTTLNQLLIQNNPIQFSAFAIPPYAPEKLSDIVKPFESRLPEIEKLRRVAAQKALATGECKRVESDELSIKSTLKLLVFSVDCSNAKTYSYNETELK
jgi:hypothetical protein